MYGSLWNHIPTERDWNTEGSYEAADESDTLLKILHRGIGEFLERATKSARKWDLTIQWAEYVCRWCEDNMWTSRTDIGVWEGWFEGMKNNDFPLENNR